MNFRLAATFVLAGISASSLACHQCNDIGCGGGFEWMGEPVEGSVVPGTYTITVELESDVYQFECTIGATWEESECAAPVHQVGDVDWNIDFGPSMDPTGDWEPQAPVYGFRLTASDTSGSDDVGNYSETRGPAHVGIIIVQNGTSVFEVAHEVEYVRDDDYRGDPACGYCDETQTRTGNW